MAGNISALASTRLHWEISAFAELVAQTAEQKAEKADICAELQAIGQQIWGSSAFVAQHGSSMSGAALRCSDLDLVIGGLTDLPKPDNPTGNGYLPGARAVVAAQLEKLMKVLSEDSEAASSLDLVPHARMPLLKVKMHSTDVKITLSPLPVAEIPAHQTAELVARAFSDVPHAQKLVLLMKALFRDDNYLSSFFGIHSGGVSSYTITLMVIAFCKFQAAQVHHAEHVDLGWCLLTLLSFYSDASHFDTQSHAIDVAADNGFAQKVDAQAALDPRARRELAARLCAIDPVSRHDIGSGSYRFTELLTHLRSLRLHLMAQMAHAPAPAADVDALQRMTSSSSYRSALSPRRKGGDLGAEPSLPPTPLWVKRFLPLLTALINVGALVPLSADLDPPSPSLLIPGTPSELALAGAQAGEQAVYMPGHGPMTLGQISNMAYQAAPVAGQFTTEAFPTIQESVAMATQREGQQPALGQLMYAVSQQQAPMHGPGHYDRSGSGWRNGWGHGKAHRNNDAGPMRPEMYGAGGGDMPRPPTQAHGAAAGGKKGRGAPASAPAGSTNGSYKSNNAAAPAAGGAGDAGTNGRLPENHPVLSAAGLRAPPLAKEVSGDGKASPGDGVAPHGMRTSSAAALSMRSKSAGTSASSAMSPMPALVSPIPRDTACGDTSRAPTDPGISASTGYVSGGGSRRRSHSEPPSAAAVGVPADHHSAISALRDLGKSSSRGRGTGGEAMSSATPSTPGSAKRSGSQGPGAHGPQRRERNGAGGQGPPQGHHRRHNSFGSNNGNSYSGRGGLRKKDHNGQRTNYPGQGAGHGGGPDGRPQHGRGWHGPPRNNGGGFHQPWRGNHYTPGGGPPTQRHGQQRRGPFPPPNAPGGMQLVPVWPAFRPQQGGQAMGHAPYYMVQPMVPMPQPPHQVPGGNGGIMPEGTNAGGMPPAGPRTPASGGPSATQPALPAGQGGGRPAATPPGPQGSGQGTPVGSPPVWGGGQMMHPTAMIPPQQMMSGQMMYVPVPAQAVPPNMAVGSDRKAPGAVPLHLPPHVFGPGGISPPSGRGHHMQGTGFHQRGVFRGPKNRTGGRGGGSGGAGPGPEHMGPRPRGPWGQDGGGRGGYGNQGGYQGHKRRDAPGGGRGDVRWAGAVPVASAGGSRE